MVENIEFCRQINAKDMSSAINVITYNVNGIRSALSKGLLDWLRAEKPEVLCLQELKAEPSQFDASAFEKLGYHCFWKPAVKKGYSGVALLSLIRPDQVMESSGMELYDAEGRILRADFGDTTLFSCYFPSGTTGEERQQFKMKFLADFRQFIDALRRERKKILVCGDYNICHQPIDIHDPVGNKNSSGFLPEERDWMTRFFESGWTDTFRHFNREPHQYSWWSFRANARANNKGWRIDYNNGTAELNDSLLSSTILMEVKHSDHCPVKLTLKLG